MEYKRPEIYPFPNSSTDNQMILSKEKGPAGWQLESCPWFYYTDKWFINLDKTVMYVIDWYMKQISLRLTTDRN